MQNILLAGVGGQGTVLASKIIAKCAMKKGISAHTAETIGMAQRGGCVVSHVRIGEDCFSPLIPTGQADTIIAFEPAEAVRVLPYLKKGGFVVVSSSEVKPTTDSLSDSEYHGSEMIDFLKTADVRLAVVDGTRLISECGSAKSLNIALLGAASAIGAIDITPSELREIIMTDVKEKFRASNLAALELGTKSVEK